MLSAHVDHVGIGEPINGDRMSNGAMDNGSGTAALLDIAASLRNRPETEALAPFRIRHRREKGLLGSKYFTQYPTVDPKSMVADINIDMFLPIIPLKTMVVFGLAESDRGDLAREVARVARCAGGRRSRAAAQSVHPQ